MLPGIIPFLHVIHISNDLLIHFVPTGFVSMQNPLGEYLATVVATVCSLYVVNLFRSNSP